MNPPANKEVLEMRNSDKSDFSKKTRMIAALICASCFSFGFPFARSANAAPAMKALLAATQQPAEAPMCPTAANPDANEQAFGGLSSRSVATFSSAPKTQDLYAAFVITLQNCTGPNTTLSSADSSALTKVLALFGAAKAKTFQSTLSITANNSGIKYPLLVPFNYQYDDGKSSYKINVEGQTITSWQVANSFTINYAYTANQNLQINTVTLFNNIATTIAGAGSSTAVLSAASNAYLSAGNSVLQSIAQSFFTANDNTSDTFGFDIPIQHDREITYRFRDLNNRPLATIRLAVAFTNSIMSDQTVDPTAATIPVPAFNGIQDILSASMGGPLMGTFGQAIAKEASYQSLLQATASTPPGNFAAQCDTLEGALKTTYGLNSYDDALAMAEILDYKTPYLSSKNLYNSGCFRNRSLLKTMGIMTFETVPAN
jgi:hypothetical protein